VTVIDYVDQALGTMMEAAGGGGCFSRVVLAPTVRITADSDPVVAGRLHERAHDLCFVANSVRFPVLCEARILIDDDGAGRA
jgi:organic hydroperoxide reductase OsmC/OhrA